MTCPVCFGVDTCEVSWCVNMNGARPTGVHTPAQLPAALGECPDCRGFRGKHHMLCPQYPKKGNRACHECQWYNGKHSVGCQSRGYAAVCQHPDSPDRTPPTARSAPAGAKCECGVDKTGVGGMHSSWCPRAV